MPKLIVRKAELPDRFIDTDEQIITFGRSRKSTVWINDTKASRHHCMIVKEGDIFTLVDKGSSNGTFLNGEKTNTSPINPGDAIIIGKFVIFFEVIPDNAEKYEKMALDENMTGSDGKDLAIQETVAEKIDEPDRPIYILEVVEGPTAGEQHHLEGDKISIGRHKQNTIVFEDDLVSNFHAEITKEIAGFVLTDLGSTNHTYVNGEKVIKCPLSLGTEVKIGEFKLIFKNIGKSSSFDHVGGGEPTIAADIADLHKKKKAIQLSYLATAVVIVLVIVVGYYIFKPDVVEPTKTSLAPIADNLISSNPSFEGAVAADATPQGWKFDVNSAIDAFVDDKKARSGKQSLTFRNLEGNSGNVSMNVAVLREPIPVLPGKTYNVAGYVLTENSVGFNAVRIRVFDKQTPQVYIEYYSNSVSRTHTDFVLSECLFAIPKWANSIELACVSAGNRGSIWFDDINMKEAKQLAPPFFSISSPGSSARVTLDRFGNYWITGRSGELLLIARGFVLREKGCAVETRQSLQASIIEPRFINNMKKALLKGSFYGLQTNSPIPFDLSITAIDAKFNINHSIAKKLVKGYEYARLAFLIDMSKLANSMAIARTNEITPLTSYEQAEIGVGEIILGEGKDLLSIAFGVPVSMKLHGITSSIVSITVEAPPEDIASKGVVVSAIVQSNSPAIEAFIQGNIDRVRALIRSGSLLEAENILKALEKKFPTNSIVITENKRGLRDIKAALGNLQSRLDALLREIETAAKEKNADTFDNLRKQLNVIVEEIKVRAPGSEIEEKSANALKRCSELAVDLSKLLFEKNAERLLNLAKKAFEEEKYVLCKAVLDNFIKKYPESKLMSEVKELSQKAGDKLSDLKAAHQEWEEVREIAESNLVRGRRAAAKKAVEDFLKKYPFFTPAKEYLRLLEG